MDSAKWVRWPRDLREQGQFTHIAESDILKQNKIEMSAIESNM